MTALVIKDSIGTIVHGMKGQPIMLAVLILNAIMVGGMVYFLLEFGEANSKRTSMILERCLPAPPRTN